MIPYTIITLFVLSLAAAGVWWYLRNQASAEGLKQAWELWKTEPDQALKLFDRALKSPKVQRDAKQRGKVHLGRAICLLRQKNFDAAFQAEQEAWKSQPLSEADLILLCKVYHQSLDKDAELPLGAIENYTRYLLLPEKAREANATQVWTNALRRSITVADNAPRDAVEKSLRHGRRMRELGLVAPWLSKGLGVLLFQADQVAEAEKELSDALAQLPGDVAVHVALGKVHRKKGDQLAARRHYLVAYSLTPSAEAAYAAAILCQRTLATPLREQERIVVPEAKTPLEMAVHLLKFVTTNRPDMAVAWNALGRARLQQKEYRDAITALVRARTLDAKLAGASALIGQCWLALGDRTLANENLQKALQEGPNHADTIRLAGDLAFTEGNLGDALKQYRRLPAPTADDPELVERLAICQLEVGDPATVIPMLDGRTDLTPEKRLVLGRALARTGNWPKALVTLEALPTDQQTPAYKYYLGAALAANGRYRDAELRLLEAKAVPELTAKCQHQLGHLYAMQGKHEAARGMYDASGNGAAFDLGRLALLSGDWAEAKRRFSQAGDGAGASLHRLGLAVAEAEDGSTDGLKGLLDDPALGSFAHERFGREHFQNNQYVQTLEHLEKAVKGRKQVSSALLGQLADSYLLLGRFPEALPPLVELGRRHPKSAAVRHNLAWCRYRLGQEHFRRGRWDQAREEWNRASTLFRPILPDQAKAIRQAEWEAAYRTVVDILSAPDYRGVLEHAQNLAELACKEVPEQRRWWFAAGLASALAGLHAPAAERFAQARKLDDQHVGFVLGAALSYLAQDRTDAARTALEQTLKLSEANPKAPALFPVAARFALASCLTKQQKWTEAADRLTPLLDHPLLKASKRIQTQDVAQLIVAYYGLAGDKNRAADVAKKHLGDNANLGNLLIGLVQIEGGDYAGAADTLETAYRQKPEPAVLDVLVSCLLAEAARQVLGGDLKAAVSVLQRLQKLDPANTLAQQLLTAIQSGSRLQNLDLKQLDKTITECETMLKDSKGSASLTRTLAVLYHRRAIQSDVKGSAQTQWDVCTKYWRQNLLKNDAFWTGFEAEYNEGKGKLERLKGDGLSKWREELPRELARDHAAFTTAYLREKDSSGVQRHLNLIWEWDPEFVPPEDFLVKELASLDDKSVGILADQIPKIKSEASRKALGEKLGIYWMNKALEKNNAAVEMVNRADASLGALAALVQAAPALGPMMRPQIRDALNTVIDRCETAVPMLRDAKSIMEKAKKLAGHLPKVQEEYARVTKNLGDIEKSLSDYRSLRNRM